MWRHIVWLPWRCRLLGIMVVPAPVRRWLVSTIQFRLVAVMVGDFSTPSPTSVTCCGLSLEGVVSINGWVGEKSLLLLTATTSVGAISLRGGVVMSLIVLILLEH
jgi:hypothetical protein